MFLEVTNGSEMSEVVADVSLNESLAKGTVTVSVAGDSPAARVEICARLLDPKGGR